MTERLSGLIVGERGRMRECLQALLVSIPQIEQVYQADDIAQAQEILSDQKINFVLIDSILSDEGRKLLVAELKDRSDAVKSLVIVENSTEERLIRDAGADEVLIRGSSAVSFIEALCRIVPLDSLRERISLCTEEVAEQEMKSSV